MTPDRPSPKGSGGRNKSSASGVRATRAAAVRSNGRRDVGVAPNERRRAVASGSAGAGRGASSANGIRARRAAAARAGTRLDAATPVARAASTKTTAPKPTAAAEVTQSAGRPVGLLDAPAPPVRERPPTPVRQRPISAPNASAPKGDVSTAPLGTVVDVPVPRNGWFTAAEVRRARVAADRPVVAEPSAPEPSTSRAGFVALAVSLALVVQSIGYAIGRSGNDTTALRLFFIGLVGIFVPCAWRLLSPRVGRRERLQVVVILGLALVGSTYLVSPLMPSSFDELLHQATLWNIIHSRTLFTQNALLPVSPYYPGLELATASVKWLTGVPMVVAELTVIAVSRLILTLVVFLFVERVTKSSFAGGVGVLVYAASPQFYNFNAAFAYQTLALALGAGAVYLLLREVDTVSPRLSWRLALPVACLAGVTVTHHLVSWITVAFLCAWTAILWASGRRPAARVVGTASAAGLVFVVSWTIFNEARLLSYLDPLLSAAFDGLVGVITGSTAKRELFHTTAATGGTPFWQELVLLGSAAIFLVLLMMSLWAVVFRRVLRGGVQRLLASVVALGYIGVLGSHFSSASSDVGTRASTFVYFGFALVCAAWFVTLRKRPRVAISVAVATVCFVGSMILGTGPQWSYVPGRYMPSADMRSVDGPSIAAAQWAATNLPVGSRIAADRDNAALMGAVGHLTAVNSLATSVNVGALYFDGIWGRYDNTVVRRGQIRYLLVDDRLLDGPPAYGYYIQVGETQGKERLTKAELAKLAHIPGAVEIYDNGPIQIYDLSKLLGLAPTVGAGGSGGLGGEGLNWFVLGPALAVGLVWLLRRRPSMEADRVVRRAPVGGRAGHRGRVCARPVGDPDDAGGARDSGRPPVGRAPPTPSRWPAGAAPAGAGLGSPGPLGDAWIGRGGDDARGCRCPRRGGGIGPCVLVSLDLTVGRHPSQRHAGGHGRHPARA